MTSSNKQRIALLYCLFAVIATVFNLLSQELSVRTYQGMGYIILSIIIGTGVGLVVKYILDKKYIFKYQTNNMREDSKVFILYTVMGIITTVIFWAFEYGFELIFNDKTMRYIGACIGLAIGYIVKYRLDKKYVFV